MGIRIRGTGSYLPEKILSNFDLEAMVDTSDEWIRTRTGIAERHLAAPEQATSDLAYAAAERALAMAGIDGAELDAIVVATITPDHVFPSTGCILQRRLGAAGAFCFDLEAACSGLLYSLEVAYSLMKVSSAKYRNVLVVGAEKLSSIVNWEDRSTCVLFGDGAGAVVLSNDGTDSPDFLVCSDLHADGNYSDILIMPAGGSRCPASEESIRNHAHSIHMEGRDVYKLAVTGMVSACRTVLKNAKVAASEIRCFIPHQANSRIIDAIAQRLDVPGDRVYCNIDRCGNTSAASIGICLDEIVRGGQVSEGDYMLLTAFGGGLTWGAMLIRR